MMRKRNEISPEASKPAVDLIPEQHFGNSQEGIIKIR
jgi:hypothetical protein